MNHHELKLMNNDVLGDLLLDKVKYYQNLMKKNSQNVELREETLEDIGQLMQLMQARDPEVFQIEPSFWDEFKFLTGITRDKDDSNTI